VGEWTRNTYHTFPYDPATEKGAAAKPVAKPAAKPAAKPVAKPVTANPVAPTGWVAKLQARIREEIKAGRKPSFAFSTLMGKKAKILAFDEKGELTILAQGAQLPWKWSRLKPSDLKHLALAVANTDKPEDHALAAYFLLKAGDSTKAAVRLAKAGPLAKEVRAAAGQPSAPARPRSTPRTTTKSTSGQNIGSVAAGKKVVRGGSWRERPKLCRSSYRLPYPNWQKVYNVGFRVIIED